MQTSSSMADGPSEVSANAAAFDVVALGSSAGGLEALSTVLRALPADFPAAVLVLQHMRGQSTLVDVLQRQTALPVAWVTEGARLSPGRVLVCPPLRGLEVHPDGMCWLTPEPRTAAHRPIDRALESLADSYGPQALAVILTGMLNDGAAGVMAIKQAGGTVIVQSEDTAEQPSMPHAAIETGVVDLVLPLSEIGPLLAKVVAGSPLPRPRSEIEAADALFEGPGEMRSLLRSIDWTATPLGPVSAWPSSLSVSVSNALASGFPMCVYWGPEYLQLYNDAFISLLGAKHPTAVGRPAAVTWSEIWDQVGGQFDRVMRTGEALYAEDLLFQPDRGGFLQEEYHTYSYSPLRGEQGEVRGVLNTVYETTHRVLSERRLRTLQELAARTTGADTVQLACERAVEALAQNPFDLPFALIYHLDRTQLRANLVAATGVEAGGFAAPRVVELIGERPLWPLAKVVREGVPLVLEDLAVRFRGLMAGPWPAPPTAALLLPLRPAADEQPIGALIVGLSPRRILDTPYRNFLDLVAAQVVASIGQARAVTANRERLAALAALDRAKTAFFSNVSHEFRTPLTLMLGPLQEALQRRSELPTSLAAELEVATRNGRRLLGLVNTLLDFSRAEAGRLEAHFEPVDLAADTADLASVFRSAAERAGLRLVVDCPPLPKAVWVDRGMWEKIVSNLLSNALKFTFEGEIRVELRELAQHAQLTVRDTGVGIPAKELPHLFKRFHRVPGARARTQEGSGIGLALVDQLVRLHQGRVRVTSEVGQGTTFTVWIPLVRRLNGATLNAGARPAAPQDPNSTAALLAADALTWADEDVSESATTMGSDLAAADGPLPGRIVGARVLVVDDNRDMRDYLKRLLTAAGWEVETAHDGEAALMMIQRWHPDLVLADVMLPGLDGFGLLRSIRQLPEVAGLPVILVTARAGEEAAIEGLMAGADDYIAKPFGARELVARVSGQLELARLRRESEARYQALFEASPIPFVVLTPNPPDYTITAANKAYFAATLTTPESLIGRRLFDVFPDDPSRPGQLGSDALAISLERVLATKQTDAMPRVRYDLLLPGGYEPHWWEAINAPMLDASGQVSAIIHQVNRVTELHLAQEAERQRQEREVFLLRFSDLLRAQPDEQSIKEETVRLLGEHLHADRCYISEVFEQQGFSTVGPERVRPDLPPMTGVYRLSDYPETMRQLATRPMVVHDAANDPRFSDSEKALLAGLPQQALLVAPLRKGPRKVIWALVAAMATPRHWTEAERVLLEEVAERTWAAIERALAEAALRESEARLQTVLQALPVGVWITDVDGRVIGKNKQADKIWAGNAPLVEGMDQYHQYQSWDAISGRELETEDFPPTRTLRTGEPVEAEEYRIRRLAGSTGFVLVSAIPIKDDEGRLTGAIAINLDITERKRAVEERERLLASISESSEKLTTILGSITDEVWFADVNGTLTLLNLQARTNLGLDLNTSTSVDDVVNALEILNPDGTRRSPEETPLLKSLKGEKVSGEEIIRHRKTGELRYRLFSSTPVRDTKGEIIGAVATSTDITERKERERQRDFLLQFSDALRAEQGADAVAKRALEMLIEYLRLDRSYITTYDDEAG